jgi:hypothetical protein
VAESGNVDHIDPATTDSLSHQWPVFTRGGPLEHKTAVLGMVEHQAVDAVAAVSSPRAHDRLRVLDTVLAPLHDNAGVAELRGHLATITV